MMRIENIGLKPARILLLFGEDWDHAVLNSYTERGRYEFFCEGFDLFSFPSNARLMWFNVWSFVDKMVERYAGRIDGVFSSNEQFGAICASLVAQRLGLPGQAPESILRAQHKYEARKVVHAVAPELCPEFSVIPYTVTPAEAARLQYPLFVKPVKATFSVLAKRCDSPAELIEHLTFKVWEKHIIKRLIEPMDQAFKRFPEFTVGARNLVIETPMSGHQINVDGFIASGQVHLLGIIDEVMYPGTMSFMRFDYPSNLAVDVQEQVRAATEVVVNSFGLVDGLFNLEFFYDEGSNSLKLIEINPRLAAQLARFYEWVDGIDVYQLGFDMSLPNFSLEKLVPKPTSYGAASSFVWRSFDGSSCPRLPTADDWAWLKEHYPQARLEVYAKSGGSLQRDMKWLQSHRWALLNIPGDNLEQTRQHYEAISARLQWPAPY